MKTLAIMALGVGLQWLPSLGQADVGYNVIKECQFWSYSQEARGYICSTYPRSVYVPDAQSLNMEVRILSQRIDQLEKRIQELEKKP